MEKKTILSGIQATGRLTLGNYIGAINNWLKLQEEYQCNFCIVDLHTLTIRNDPEELRKNTLNLLALYVASGLDPDKCNLFIQSHVSEHAELQWILNCYTYMGELSRMTQFKDKSAKHQDNINSGLYTYPVLMASDILLYQADLVPVGEDQRQHLEITRDIGQRFNNLYGKTFVIPDIYVGKTGARVMGLQDPTSKMSKSSKLANDAIYLDDTPEDIIQKVKKAVTDSEGIVRYDVLNKPGISNLMSIYGALNGKNDKEIEKEFSGQNYGIFKQALADIIVETLAPMQKRHKEIVGDYNFLETVYRKGADKARVIANKTLIDVYDKIGLVKK